MPAEVHAIEKKLEGKKGIRNPWAMAWAIYDKRRSARRVTKHLREQKS